MAAVRDARTMKWLRQRLTGSRCDTMLMQKIFDFVMHETSIDIEKLRKSLHHQVRTLNPEVLRRHVRYLPCFTFRWSEPRFDCAEFRTC